MTLNKLEHVLGGTQFVLTPVLAVRVGHDTLCAHWMLLALMWFGVSGVSVVSAAGAA